MSFFESLIAMLPLSATRTGREIAPRSMLRPIRTGTQKYCDPGKRLPPSLIGYRESLRRQKRFLAAHHTLPLPTPMRWDREKGLVPR